MLLRRHRQRLQEHARRQLGRFLLVAVGVFECGELRWIDSCHVGSPPLLVSAAGHRHALVSCERRAAPITQPVGFALAGLLQGLGVESHGQPTDPSISSWMRRFNSTAYSRGSSLVNGSMKPLTIIVSASLRVMPRLIK